MAQTFRVMKKVAATCSGLPDEIFKELVEELGFPALSDNYEDFDGAGATGPTIEIFTGGMEKLTMTMKLIGTHPELYSVFRKRLEWTFKGVVENELTGEKTKWEVTVTARLGSITPEAKSRTGLHKHDYELKGIMAARIVHNGTPVFDWTWGEPMEIGGVNVDAEDDAILGV